MKLCFTAAALFTESTRTAGKDNSCHPYKTSDFRGCFLVRSGQFHRAAPQQGFGPICGRLNQGYPMFFHITACLLASLPYKPYRSCWRRKSPQVKSGATLILHSNSLQQAGIIQKIPHQGQYPCFRQHGSGNARTDCDIIRQHFGGRTGSADDKFANIALSVTRTPVSRFSMALLRQWRLFSGNPSRVINVQVSTFCRARYSA